MTWLEDKRRGLQQVFMWTDTHRSGSFDTGLQDKQLEHGYYP